MFFVTGELSLSSVACKLAHPCAYSCLRLLPMGRDREKDMRKFLSGLLRFYLLLASRT